ncbi:MAG: cysteine desulfurase-like protein SufS subfamily [Acidimicrobiaceae bacterium]|nr:cysteine desulfurase-like protein SufS subfamily [Acidimicrobiaceae bacterium]
MAQLTGLRSDAGAPSGADSGLSPLDPLALKADFPLLSGGTGGPLVYLDSAASSQRPQAVLDAMDDYYVTTHANVHRGVYAIAEEATRRFEEARSTVGRFIGAPNPEREIVFAKNVTEGINLVAHSWGRKNLRSGDVVVLSEIEHHANLVPWLMLAEERGIELRYLRLGADYQLDLSNLERLVDGARLVSLTCASNVLGTVVDLAPVVRAAHAAGALVLADGAQLAPHRRVDVAALGVDFFGFTGHKMLGPTGIGVLWAREELLESMPPFLGGGEMIRDVRLDGFTPNEIPWRFEAGTPPIAEAVGLGEAVRYLEAVGLERIQAHEASLTQYALERLAERFATRLTVFGPGPDPATRSGVISFALGDVHPHDVAQVLDERGICVRAGHHCAKPLMRCLGVGATTRASLYLYNDESDVDALIEGLGAVEELFA